MNNLNFIVTHSKTKTYVQNKHTSENIQNTKYFTQKFVTVKQQQKKT